MRFPRAIGGVAVVTLAAALAVPPAAPQSTSAASHREAPLISLDPSADITDFFMFRSYQTGNSDKVDLIMNVIPGEEPSSGPNYFLFDPNVLYAFNIDNDMDGVADDVRIEFQFSTEIRGAVDAFDLFLGYVGCNAASPPPPTGPACRATLPPITALDGPGSEGLGLRQHYTIAIELPAPMLTKDGQPIATTSQTRLGAYASTSRRKERVLTGARKNEPKDADLQQTAGPWVQIQRLANPLINEAIIGTEDKDEWNAREPEDESLFLDYYQNPRLALALQVVYGVPAATTGRDDLVDLLLKYNPTDAQLSELLRVDLSVAPTPFATQRRLTV